MNFQEVSTFNYRFIGNYLAFDDDEIDTFNDGNTHFWHFLWYCQEEVDLVLGQSDLWD